MVEGKPSAGVGQSAAKNLPQRRGHGQRYHYLYIYIENSLSTHVVCRQITRGRAETSQGAWARSSAGFPAYPTCSVLPDLLFGG